MTAPATESVAPPTRPRLSGRAVALTTGATLVAVVLHLLAQAGMMLTTPGWTIDTFRWYFAYDQLSYLSIVTNGAHGYFGTAEPFTLTGTNHYPRGYYLLLGAIADVTGGDPTSVWTVTGLAFQAVLVAAIAVATVWLTRRPWTALLAFVPFVLGSFSIRAVGSWYTTLESHAALWSAFGVMYTINGESAALCVAGISVLALLLVAARRITGRWAFVVAVVASAAIGLLANVQTYSFLTTTFLVTYVAAVYGLVVTRRLWPALLTVAMLAGAVLVGPAVADSAGRLAPLVVAMLPTIPGLLLLCARTRWRPVWCAVALVVLASPQTLGTVLGIRAEDPFLVYREASSANLGIPLETGLRGALVLALPLVAVAVVGVWRRHVLWTAYGVGVLVAWPLVATNDLWGANQEPYRFWIDTFALTAMTLVPVGLWVVTTLLARVPREGRETPAPEPPATGRASRWVLAGATALVALVALASTQDFVAFRRQVTEWGFVDLGGERSEAMAQAAEHSDGTIVLPDPCIDPFVLKPAWGGATGFYNLGLAWPDNQTQVRAVLDRRAEGTLDPAQAEAAGIGWVLTDTACQYDWPQEHPELQEEARVPYAGGEIVLWRLGA